MAPIMHGRQLYEATVRTSSPMRSARHVRHETSPHRALQSAEPSDQS